MDDTACVWPAPVPSFRPVDLNRGPSCSAEALSCALLDDAAAQQTTRSLFPFWFCHFPFSVPFPFLTVLLLHAAHTHSEKEEGREKKRRTPYFYRRGHTSTTNQPTMIPPLPVHADSGRNKEKKKKKRKKKTTQKSLLYTYNARRQDTPSLLALC
ncbi:hypothetical protein VFPFJ_07816 [Purpureocillium lilacinum]|uniref:Uncharacterized protein n=1 Tax=Purpureocillium lilacinum TaxID=33203 RepID=A0A179H5J1_PURLI|nr:hypothetical protein VFPFJ_07816 [Purpureocillium lilacinum]OAQ85427.1 hypothetical protein VFPFJ_07816 [Purpureocillium lilacinum]